MNIKAASKRMLGVAMICSFGLIAGCNSIEVPSFQLPSLSGVFGSSSGIDTVPPTSEPQMASTPLPDGGSTLGKGKVKIALILPLSGSGQAGAAANMIKNAAELALSEFQNPNIQLLIKDDRGSVQGARTAAQEALSEGAELILGPLFASSVSSAGALAKVANVPVVAFSTDSSVASSGIYLLSFMVEDEVERLVRYASNQNRKTYAALIPDTPYGQLVEAKFQQEVAKNGGRVVILERYSSDSALPAVMAKIAQFTSGANPQADALFIPEKSDRLASVAAALTRANINTAKVKVMGTGVWNEASVFSLPALAGSWFVGPERAGFQAFSVRYNKRFGANPARIATIGYDAVSLAAALVRTQGERRFSAATLTNSAGFSGIDGVFRFQSDGTNDRALAIYEIKSGASNIISPAPRSLTSGM